MFEEVKNSSIIIPKQEELKESVEVNHDLEAVIETEENAALDNTIIGDNEKSESVESNIEINNTEGRVVTGVLKDGKILYNIGCQNEITKEVFIDRIYNDDGGIEKHPYRKEYLKIIDMIEAYLSK